MAGPSGNPATGPNLVISWNDCGIQPDSGHTSGSITNVNMRITITTTYDDGNTYIFSAVSSNGIITICDDGGAPYPENYQEYRNTMCQLINNLVVH